jgi:hypothetical protein
VGRLKKFIGKIGSNIMIHFSMDNAKIMLITMDEIVMTYLNIYKQSYVPWALNILLDGWATIN